MATSEIDILLEAKDNASAAIKKTADETDRLTKSAGNFNSVGSTMTAGFAAMATALAGIASAGAVVKSAMDFEQTSASFQTMLGSVEQAQALLGQLSKFAAETPFEFPEIASAGKSLLAFGVAAQDIQGTLRQIGDIAAGVNVPLGELAEIYGKARVQGRLFAEDINQLQGRGIPIVQELAKQFGVSESAIKKMVEQGKIGFPEMQKAFQSLTSEGGKFYAMMARQSTTMAGLFSTASDAVMQLGRDLLGISQTGEVRVGSLFETMRNGIASFITGINNATPYILGFANGIGTILTGLLDSVNAIINGIVNTFNWMGANIDTVMRIVVAGAVGVAASSLFMFTNTLAIAALGVLKLGAQMAVTNIIAVAQTAYFRSLLFVQQMWLAIQVIGIRTIGILSAQMVINNTIAVAQASYFKTLGAIKAAWNAIQLISIRNTIALGARMLWTNGVAIAQAGAIGFLTLAKKAWNIAIMTSSSLLLNLGKSILLTTARVAVMSVAFLGIAAVVAAVVVAVYKNWDNLKKRLAPLFEYVASIGQKVPDLIAAGWNGLVNVVSGSIQAILSSTKTVAEWLSSMGVDIIDPKTIDSAIATVGGFSESLKFSGQDVRNTFASIKDSAMGAFEAVTSSITDVGNLKMPPIDLPVQDLGKSSKEASKQLEELKKRLADVSEQARQQFTGVSEKIGEQNKKIKEMRSEYDKLKEKYREVGETGKKELAKIDDQLTKQAQKIAGIQGQGALDIGGRAIDIENELKAKTDEKKKLQQDWIDLQSKSSTLSTEELRAEETAIINKQTALQLERDKLEAELKLAQTTITSAEMQKARDEAAKSETQKIIERTVARLDEAEVERAEIVKTRAEKLISIEAEKVEIKKQMDEKRDLIMREKRLYGSLIAERMSLDSMYFNTFGAQIEKQITKTKEAIQLMRELQQEGLAVSGARADGGPVTGGQTYLVGERGPELFTPSRSGTIIPNGGSGTTININLGGVSVRNEADIHSITKQIKDELTRSLQLYKLGIN